MAPKPLKVASEHKSEKLRSPPDNKRASKGPKKRVSISGIFKNRASLKRAKLSTTGRGLNSPQRQPRTSKHRPLHPSALAFRENVVSARDHLVTTSAGHITSTHVSLLDTLSETASAFRDHRARYQTQTDELVRPLGEEQILLTTASKSRGKEESVVSLASRVERFRGVLRDTESELERQWREWDEVQREILGVAGEMIGVEAVEAILKGGTTPQTKRVGSHVKDEVDEELERATERLRREIAALTEETMKTSDEMDKELDIKAKQERQKIMSLVSEIGA